MLRNTIKMLQEMRLKVVVEGVETKEQKNSWWSKNATISKVIFSHGPWTKQVS